MTAEAVAVSEVGLCRLLGSTKAGAVKEYAVYDIRIIAGGAEWQPAEAVSVTVRDPAIEAGARGLPNVARISAGRVISDTAVDSVTDGGREVEEVLFQADGFSAFMLYTYSAAFSCEGRIYGIPGNSSVLLSEVFSGLGIWRNAADAVEVSFSDPSLMAVSQTDKGWELTSVKAFSGGETLKVRFKNDSVLELRSAEISAGVEPDAAGQVIMTNDEAGCTDGLSFSDYRLLPEKTEIGGSDTMVSGLNAGLRLDTASYHGISSDTCLIYGKTIAAGESVSLDGSVAVFTFRDAAVDKTGAYHDVKLTLSDLHIKNAAGVPLSETVIARGGFTLCAAGNISGVSRAYLPVSVSVNVKLEIADSEGGTMSVRYSDIDQPDRTGAACTYDGEASERIRIVSGAASKAFVPVDSTLHVSTVSPGGTTADGLLFRGTEADVSTVISGFSMQAETDGGYSISWTGSGCGTQLIGEAHSFAIRPQYGEYGSESLSSGNTGGTVSMKGDHDGTEILWDETEHTEEGYTQRYFIDRRQSELIFSPAVGYRLSEVTKSVSSEPSSAKQSVLSQVADNRMTLTAEGDVFVDAYFEPVTETITIHKRALSGAPVKRTGFTVSGSSSVHGSFSLSGTTDENGDLTFEIPYGSAGDIYTITEATAAGAAGEDAVQYFTWSDEPQEFTFMVRESTVRVKTVIYGHSENGDAQPEEAFFINLEGDITAGLLLHHGETSKTIYCCSDGDSDIVNVSEIVPMGYSKGYYVTACVTAADGTVTDPAGAAVTVKPGDDVLITVTNIFEGSGYFVNGQYIPRKTGR